MRTASAHTLMESDPPHDRPVCSRCGSYTFERLQRIGFVQRRILPFFNRYPWRCVICNKLTYRTARNNVELRRLTHR